MERCDRRLSEVCLEVTDRCPMNCLHCSGNCGLDRRAVLPFHQARIMIEALSSMGGERLEISGGEPLMHPHLLEIVGCADKEDLETVLYTSGFFMNMRVASKLKQAGLRRVVFNMEGATAKTHETVTQTKGSFRKVLDSMRCMKTSGIWIGVHFVPMKPNYSEFGKLLELCSKLEIDEVGALRFVPQGRGQENRPLLEMSREEFRSFTEELVEQTEVYSNIRVGRPMDFRHIYGFSTRTVCDAGISRCLVNADGSVMPCPAFKQSRRHIAGNVKKAPLSEIWNGSPVWQELRSFDHTQLGEPCSSCDHLQQCRGGCAAQRILRFGDIRVAPDPVCFEPCLRLELSS